MEIKEEIKNKNIIERITTSHIHRIFETIFGCKWSLTIYALIKKGINRPGQIERGTKGLSTKVLNQCLKKSVEFKILEKKIFNEMPPRVEYSFTDFGQRFVAVLDEVEKLSSDTKTD